MFTTPCFIRKNTPELRNKLEELGYENRHLSMVTNVEEYPLLQVYRDGFYHGIIGDECGLEFYIDCGTNEELFIALAALRDDIDYMQWFTDGKLWEKLNSDLPSRYMQLEGHKATINEIIEHFKNK